MILDEKNRPLADDELDKILPSSGYEVSITMIAHFSGSDQLTFLSRTSLPQNLLPSRALQLALPIHTRTDTTLMLNGR